jgi:hypothetical protein
MKISHKQTWDKLIYGLIYPGFLGSMLYEFVPTEKSQFTFDYFWSTFSRTPENYLRCMILVFYFLDYVHLYGDMERALKIV